ncbi:MAG: C40 family peptidase [Gammaproteobacteria bacterium]|nr:C40 family peptidase [Gammaproteobacteria bacterium]
MTTHLLKMWSTLLVFSLLISACGTPVYRSNANTGVNKTALIKTAHSLIGTPYRYGGSSPKSGFDCSGLVQYTFKQVGIDLPRTSRSQHKEVFPINRRNLQPGDLLFFRARHEHYVSHVGIYIGEGKFIHAPSRGKKVSINRLNQRYWRKYYYGAGRVL